MQRIRWIALSCLVLVTGQLFAGEVVKHAPVARHILNSAQQKTLDIWLRKHPNFRLATMADCYGYCDQGVKEMRDGTSSGAPEPGYDPYSVVGDFNSDGNLDFAIVLVDLTKMERIELIRYALLVFNGPFIGKAKIPAFMQEDMDMSNYALFFYPQSPSSGICVAPFSSEVIARLIPYRNTYKWQPVKIGED